MDEQIIKDMRKQIQIRDEGMKEYENHMKEREEYMNLMFKISESK